MLDIAANQTDRLVRLVNDILNLGRLESGNLKLVMQICDPARLMQQSVDELRAYAAEHHIVLKMTSTDTPVWAAPDSIIQTLTNLISNAIKFSPPNAIVSISAERVDPTLTTTAHSGDRQSTAVLAPPSLLSSYVLFKVQDQGRGIPADKLDAIFEQFQQVDASDSREKGGTGLGLAICRNIVQQHGGQIGVNSTLGQGSTFYFTLRLPPDSFKDKL
jgi:signal transduction histidine kinase